MEFTHLFSPITIRGLQLRNRIVMLPMSTGFIEPDGSVGERFASFYAERARGGAGLIIIPFTPMEDGMHVEPGLFDDRFLPGVRSLTSRIHAHGARVAAQLILSYFAVLRGTPEAVGPSPVFSKVIHAVPRELTLEEIRLMVGEFAAAARRARDGGFDAVEVLVAGGYILNRFLSPISNTRRDEYGGSLENRMRIIIEIIERIRAEAGEDFPVICRINVEEQMPGGHTIEDSKEVVQALERAGVSIISAYTGWHESPVPTVAPSLPKGAFAHLARKVREYVNIPVIASNRINDPFIAEKILSEGDADLVGMGRALIADPDLPAKAREGRTGEIVPCLACSECLAQILTLSYGGGRDAVRSLCSINPMSGREWEGAPEAARAPKRVCVIGGGPAGMTAALAAAARGHAVTVYEKGPGPGGRLVSAAVPPYKNEIRDLIDSMYARCRKAGVEFRFNVEATPGTVRNEKPDALVVATGAYDIIPPIPGIDGTNVVLAEEVLCGTKQARGPAAVIGGGIVGCEVAEFLSEQGVREVTVIEMQRRVADAMVPTYRPFFLSRLKERGIRFETETTVTGVTDKGVSVTKNGVAGFIPADTVVLAAGYKADPLKVEQFKGCAPEVLSAGDCVRARAIKDAVEEGFSLGKAI